MPPIKNCSLPGFEPVAAPARASIARALCSDVAAALIRGCVLVRVIPLLGWVGFALPTLLSAQTGSAAVAGGQGFSVALTGAGTVLTCGRNPDGQLGDGTLISRSAPQALPGFGVASAMAAGWNHALAVKNGVVWAWGANDAGQLGDRSKTARRAPVQAYGLAGVSMVAAGAMHSLALRTDGTVWAWGGNAFGQLGTGGKRDENKPTPISGLSGVVAVAAGACHSLALKADGTLWAWGRNDSGQLGDGGTASRAIPMLVPALSAVARVAAGEAHTVAAKVDGTVWAWGDNAAGQLGDGSRIARRVPVIIPGVTQVTRIAAGDEFSLLLRSDGTVIACGANEGGQLGDDTTSLRATPVPVTGIIGAVGVGAGSRHALAILADGRVITWGENDAGQRGDGTASSELSPRQAVPLRYISRIASLAGHALAVLRDGSLWAWGQNGAGQLGDGTANARFRPVPLRLPGMVRDAAAGEFHSYALLADETVWAWGDNAWGQLGDGSVINRSLPVRSGSLAGVVALAAGVGHGLAVKRDATVWAWGRNSAGQLGDGSLQSRRSPVPISGLSDIVAVSGGERHSLALRAGGLVLAWGNNQYRQLGDGTTVTQRLAPGIVSGLSGVIRIAAGYSHNLALKNDGTVWAWGRNESGALGQSLAVATGALPVQVAGLTNVVAIAAANASSVAVKADGTVWAWGLVQDGIRHESATPVPLSDIAGAVRATARFAVLGDGTERGWRSGASGLLGSPVAKSQFAARVMASPDDADGDGMADAWELRYFGTLSRNGLADFDHDGLTDLQEFFLGTDPTRSDADADSLTDPVDARPVTFDPGALLAIVGGNNQSGPAGQLTPLPLDVAVWNTAGAAPLPGIPLVFSVTQGGGLLAGSNAGGAALAASATVLADADGSARVYYRQPESAGTQSRISVSAPAALPVSFQVQTISGDPNDTDGDGLLDAWEFGFFGNLLQTAAGDPDGDGFSNLQEQQQGRNPTKGAMADTGGAVNLRLFFPN